MSGKTPTAPQNLTSPENRQHLLLDDEPQPSPPYRAVASTSRFTLHDPDTYPPSPAYDSEFPEDLRQRDDIMGEKKDIIQEVRDAKAKPEDVSRPSEADALTTRNVHYHNDVRGPPVYHDEPETLSRPASVAGTDDEDEEDYDWSGEEDLVDEEAKFEQRMGVKHKARGFKRFLQLLFGTLIGSTFITGVLATPGILLHVYYYKPDPTAEKLYITQNVQAWLFWAAANVLISWYLAFLIDIVPIVITLFISASWGHVSENIKSRVEMYNSVKGTIKPLFYAASAWASWWIIFADIFHLFDPDHQENSRALYTHRVSQVIMFLFFLVLVICAQRMLSHAIAFAFHRTAYQDRIDAVTEALAVIEKLRNYKPKNHTPSRSPGMRTPLFGLGLPSPFTEKDHFLGTGHHTKHGTGRHSPLSHEVHVDDGEEADNEGSTVVGTGGRSTAGKGKEKRVSWLSRGNTNEMGVKAAAYDSRQSTLDSHKGTLTNNAPGNLAAPEPLANLHTDSEHRYPPSRSHSPRPGTPTDDAEVTLKQAAKVLKNTLLHDARGLDGNDDTTAGMVWNVNSATEAKRLARSIYYTFKDRGRRDLLPSDFNPAFASPELAEKAFRVFDKDNNGDISRAEIKTTLLKVYKERRFLSRSMRDVGAALKTLNSILLFFAFVILFFISLSVFGVNVGDSLTSVYSIGIAASFVFKNAASSAFDAIMFLFVTHPYDTGDRCFIDDEVFVVKKMGLFATVFTRADGTETYYFNSQLFNKFIVNVRRSGKTFENCTLQLAWRTPLEKIDALEKAMNDWLATEENRWFEPSTSVTLQHIDYQRFLEVTIGIGHNGNWQDWGLRMQRRTAFYAALQYFCRQLEINCYESPKPIIYTDPHSANFVPGTPTTQEPQPSPTSAFDTSVADLSAADVETEAKEMKPNLGFLPPLSSRESNLRARKSKGKKAMLRGVGGGDF